MNVYVRTLISYPLHRLRGAGIPQPVMERRHVRTEDVRKIVREVYEAQEECD